jgi:exonuclease VII small subunit
MTNENQFKEKMSNHKKQFDAISKNLEEVTELLNATIYRKDVYVHIKDTIKHDLLILKKKHFDMNMKQTKGSNKFKVIQSEYETKIGLKKRCSELLTSVEKDVRVKQIERTAKIQSFYDVIDKKEVGQQNR